MRLEKPMKGAWHAAARTAAITIALAAPLAAQVTPGARLLVPAPGNDPIPMGTTRGEHATRLVIRNATFISGRGTPGTNRAMPPEGPVDIVVENGRIADVVLLDPVNMRSARGADVRPKGDREIDATGMYVIPGLVEMHAHLPGGRRSALGARGHEYAFRLYLGHGVTIVRDAGSDAGIEFLREQRRLSNAGEIVAPRLVLCQRWPLPLRTWNEGNTPEKARLMVQKFKELGADCIKISKSPGHYPDVMAAAAAEGKRLGMHTMVDLKVSESDARTASNAGVRSIEHFYGFPEAGLDGSQSFPPDYNYWDEKDRFRWAGRLWQEGNRHPERIEALLDLLVKNGTNWDPTMAAYEDNRDLFRGRTLPFRETLFHPSYVDVLPDSTTHGSYHSDWKLSDELSWKEFYRIWMGYVKLFHDKGGLLTAGSDVGEAGGIFLVRELELMQEAGLHPLDVIKIATTNATEVLGMKEHCGIRVGCVADLAIVNGNPLDNFKVMYGRGYGFYGILPRGEREKHGGVRWTIKEGTVYDAQALLREAEWYVQQERQAATRAAGSH
ncbi:MAG: amidohydrolase family protein [Gemmatimonadaceae bacterium]